MTEANPRDMGGEVEVDQTEDPLKLQTQFELQQLEPMRALLASEYWPAMFDALVDVANDGVERMLRATTPTDIAAAQARVKLARELGDLPRMIHTRIEALNQQLQEEPSDA